MALRGRADDGHEYIGRAIAAGATAIVSEVTSRPPDGAAFATVDDTHSAAGRLAQAIRDWPARKLTNVAVTGTNGKTTVAHVLHSILETAGYQTGLLGTISYQTGPRSIPAVTTTPDPVSLAEMIDEMLSSAKTHLVMEVSSHALDQRRTAGVDFGVGIYTNLSGDHLDYHGDMERYMGAKLRLFEALSPSAWAVLNRDDPRADDFAARTNARVIWYGLSRAADVRACIERIDSAGTRFRLFAEGEELAVETGLIGRHNVQNCLAAAAAAIALGVELPAIVDALVRRSGVRGRLRRVGIDAPYCVFVDYAHTDDALFNVLGSLRPVVKGRIILVFGAGGDRDKTKRPRMGQVAERLADRIVITSDNPRSEDPRKIIEDIAGGLSELGLAKTEIEPDRRLGIELAITHAKPDDVVLIAGKGHETYQLIGSKRFDFDDVEVAEAIMRPQGVPK